jgi:diadenosine tetraphosphatase ApaH/serine/threonine PP2A family protein phosphatase
MEFDVIGDIHGQWEKLSALMQRLGYQADGRGWRPPAGRQALFVGDLIDRGPSQLEVVHAVRAMVDDGHAHCVMGNHEFNAVAFATPRQHGAGFLRAHTERNLTQHREFLRQVDAGSALHHELLGWFRTLPVALDLGRICAVHAWWHQPYVELLGSYGDAPLLDDAFLQLASTKGTPEWSAIEGLTKGLEVALPAGASFHDHEGIERREVRARWWDASARTYRDAALVPVEARESVPTQPLPVGMPHQTSKPVFVGHYWMTGTPAVQAPQVVCVDYSAAKDGPLVAYRWQGEDLLDPGHFEQAG